MSPALARNEGGSAPEPLAEARVAAEARLTERRAEHAALESRELGWANASAALLLSGLLLALLASVGVVPLPAGGLLAVTALGLVPLVLVRRRWSVRRVRRGYAVDWLERARARLDEQFDFGQPDGTAYLERTHAFAYDLAVFGAGSLFQRVNACHTVLGRDALAAWLADDRPRPDLSARAAAVRELLERHADREALEIELRALAESGARHPADVLAARTRALVAWGAEPVQDADAGAAERILTLALPVTALAGAVLTLVLGWHWLWALGPYLVNVFYARRFRDLDELTDRFTGVADTLSAWTRVLETVATLSFRSPLLSETIAAVAGTDSPAPTAVAELQRAVHRLAQRQNAYWALTGNVLLLSDVRARRALLRWKVRHGSELGAWMGAVAGLETLLSLTTWAEATPDATWPVSDGTGPLLDATALAHPLLPRTARVPNDVQLLEEGALVVVTGSNMSGKSTWLRSAGLAVVLARAGLPVPATRLRLRPLSVVTSMNVEDSLRSGLSRFHAEVRRLRFCLDTAAAPGPTLVLLDEILSGTNSRERHAGTVAVLKRLVTGPTATLVSTHDLSLAALADDPTVGARVVHFTDAVVDGQMTFDYRLREGPLPSTNALEVMRLEGIEVDEEG